MYGHGGSRRWGRWEGESHETNCALLTELRRIWILRRRKAPNDSVMEDDVDWLLISCLALLFSLLWNTLCGCVSSKCGNGSWEMEHDSTFSHSSHALGGASRRFAERGTDEHSKEKEIKRRTTTTMKRTDITKGLIIRIRRTTRRRTQTRIRRRGIRQRIRGNEHPRFSKTPLRDRPDRFLQHPIPSPPLPSPPSSNHLAQPSFHSSSSSFSSSSSSSSKSLLHFPALPFTSLLSFPSRSESLSTTFPHSVISPPINLSIPSLFPPAPRPPSTSPIPHTTEYTSAQRYTLGDSLFSGSLPR